DYYCQVYDSSAYVLF
nr:immunoglobulin light chain junction region [Macaca mulatta]MOX17356.1 immunoglobulin light chain junction region [Macaca mulatta]MOX17848.1 immunoglobulin light chain junction region [Macaca mulatta]